MIKCKIFGFILTRNKGECIIKFADVKKNSYKEKTMENQDYTVSETEIKSEKKFESVLSAQTKTKEFLIFTVCFTVMMASFLFSKLTGGVFEIIKGFIPAICMIVATVGLWSSRAAKDPAKLSKAIKKASAYDKYLFIIYSFATIAIMLLYVGAMILVGVITFKADTPMTELVKILIVVSIVFLVPMIFVGRLSNIYEQRRNYFRALGEYNLSGEYNLEKYKLKKVPVIWSYILGGWNLVLGIISFLSSLLLKLVLSLISGYLSSVELGEDLSFIQGIIDNVAEFVSGSAASVAILGISNIILGGYYVFSAIWMSKVDKAIREAE
jgi:hypothetical protein